MGFQKLGSPEQGAAASPLSMEDTGYHCVTLPLCGCARKCEMNPKFRRSVLCSLRDTALLRRAHAALAQEEGFPSSVKKVIRKRQFRREAPCGSHQSQTSLLLQDAVTIPPNLSVAWAALWHRGGCLSAGELLGGARSSAFCRAAAATADLGFVTIPLGAHPAADPTC